MLLLPKVLGCSLSIWVWSTLDFFLLGNCYENWPVKQVTQAASGSASTVTFKPIPSNLLIKRCCCVC